MAEDVTIEVEIGGIGPQGPAGPGGPAGPAGPAGTAGPTGPSSTVPGPAGPVGPAGAAGPDGAAGPTGATGSQGASLSLGSPFATLAALDAALPAGDANVHIIAADGFGYYWDGSAWISGGAMLGPAGPTGPTGPTGPAGSTGSTGATGPGGPAGPTGPTGPTGLTGTAGAAGASGATGAPGATGATGATGAAGATGATGATGSPGVAIATSPLTFDAGTGTVALDPAVALAKTNMPDFIERGPATAFTTYNRWDVVVYFGARILIKNTFTTGASPVFISSTNYVRLSTNRAHVYAVDFGCNGDGVPGNAGANTVALQAAITAVNPTNAVGVGGYVELPVGNFYTNATIDVPNGVHLVGQGTFGTYWSLADGSNCTMLRAHTSTGSGNSNGFLWSFRDFSMDCRQDFQGVKVTDAVYTSGSTTISSATRAWVSNERLTGTGLLPDTIIVAGTQAGSGPFTATMSLAAQQTPATVANVFCGLTAPIYAIHCQTNPVNTSQTGDWGFDPSGLIFNVAVKNARDAAFINVGRSANKYVFCKTSVSRGIGYIGSFDTRYVSCESDFSAWHGWDFRGSSEQIVGCKSYNSGQAIVTPGMASNLAHGYFFNLFTQGGQIAMAGCDAQQNTGDGYYLKNSMAVSISGCTAAYNGFTATVSTPTGVTLDGVGTVGCNVSVTSTGMTNTSALKIINGADQNHVVMSHQKAVGVATLGPAVSAGSALASNTVTMNGYATNAPGLVGSATLDSAYMKRYSLATSTGSHHNIGVQGTQGVAVLNRMELVPFFPERGALQTITEITFRNGSTSVATAVLRQGIYSSNKLGGNVFTLEQELAAPVTADTLNVVHTTALATAITVDPVKLYWIGSAPQTALATFQTAYGDYVAGSTANPSGGYAYTLNGVTGALPATITFGTTTGPVHIAGGIAVGVTLTG